jgi:DNA-binding response OmpR family regulator
MNSRTNDRTEAAAICGASVLIVDDIKSVRHLVSVTLRGMSINKIFEAKDGSEALQVLEREEIDLVISDWMMPNISGIEFVTAVRADKRWANLPVLMVTGKDDYRDVEDALEAGVAEVISKPFAMAELQERVEKILTDQSKKEYQSLVLLEISSSHAGQSRTSEMLRALGFGAVLKASSGARALELIESQSVDIVISDWDVADISGLKILETVRRNSNINNIPFIVLTERSGTESVMKAVKAGVSGYLTIPFDLPTLRKKIDSALAHHIQ